MMRWLWIALAAAVASLAIGLAALGLALNTAQRERSEVLEFACFSARVHAAHFQNGNPRERAVAAALASFLSAEGADCDLSDITRP